MQFSFKIKIILNLEKNKINNDNMENNKVLSTTHLF